MQPPLDQVRLALHHIDHGRWVRSNKTPTARWVVEAVAIAHDAAGLPPEDYISLSCEQLCAALDPNGRRPGKNHRKLSTMWRRLWLLIDCRVLECFEQPHDPANPARRALGSNARVRVNDQFDEWIVPWLHDDRNGALLTLDAWGRDRLLEEVLGGRSGSLFATSYGAKRKVVTSRSVRHFAKSVAKPGEAEGVGGQRLLGLLAEAVRASLRETADDSRNGVPPFREETAVREGPGAAPPRSGGAPLLSLDPSDLSLGTERESASQPAHTPAASEPPGWLAAGIAAIEQGLSRRDPPEALWGDGYQRVLARVRTIGPDFDAAAAEAFAAKGSNVGNGYQLGLRASAAGRPRPAPEVINLVHTEADAEPSDDERAEAAQARASARALLRPGTAGPGVDDDIVRG